MSIGYTVGGNNFVVLHAKTEYFRMKNAPKEEKYKKFEKKPRKVLQITEKALTLHPQSDK